MGFTKTFVTRAGVGLMAEIIAGNKQLEISAVMGGKSEKTEDNPADIEEIVDHAIEFCANESVKVENGSQIRLPIYYENSKQTEGVSLSEIGIFAKNEDGAEILLAIATSYDRPLYLPPLSKGRLELRCECIIELSLTPDVTITLPSSTVYLTRPEAMQLFWQIGEQYPATEIIESVGRTTEAHQRMQDEEIRKIWSMIESGSTSGTMMEIDTREPLKWRIVGDNGYYDAKTASYRA